MSCYVRTHTFVARGTDAFGPHVVCTCAWCAAAQKRTVKNEPKATNVASGNTKMSARKIAITRNRREGRRDRRQTLRTLRRVYMCRRGILGRSLLVHDALPVSNRWAWRSAAIPPDGPAYVRHCHEVRHGAHVC